MKKIILSIILCLFFTVTSEAKFTPAKLKYSLDFLVEKTLESKKQNRRSEIPLPTFHFESQTPLKQFQDAIEKQWGFRPDVFTNAFAIDNNQIYIMDDEAYYRRNKRCMDDSVVHELVHYIQVKYQGWDLEDESLEWDAIEHQTAFRHEFCKL